jgi:hypothetical protein
LEARSKLFWSGAAVAASIAFAGCGGGERQDANEPEGNFPIDVVRASFPKQQQLAKDSNLEIVVRNAGDKTIPNIAVTVTGLDYRKAGTDLADPNRPVFAVSGVEREIGGFPSAKSATPLGCDTAYVNTWACGPLAAGKEKTFTWGVTAIKAGPYKVSYRVAAGLNGKAKGVVSGGDTAPAGSFEGTVSRAVPKVRIADDGKTVVMGR